MALWALIGGGALLLMVNGAAGRSDPSWFDPEFLFLRLVVLNVAFAAGALAGGIAGYFYRA